MNFQTTGHALEEEQKKEKPHKKTSLEKQKKK